MQLLDFPEEGIRPAISAGDCRACSLCLDVCPGVRTDFATRLEPPEHRTPNEAALGPEFTAHWGPVLEIWEGHAVDPDIRFKGSSGGVLTALALYCVDRAGMHGVLHTGQDPDDPVRNRTRLSRTRAELLAATGSRYSPASVCNGLNLVEVSPTPCAIVGQPAEIAALEKARRRIPALDRNIGVTLSFFCAGSPPTAATVALLDAHKVEQKAVVDLRYRGLGWPGHFAPTLSGKSAPQFKVSYNASWEFLQRFRPWSVQLWPDCSGELADISCGDPWYTEPDGTNPGSSLVLVRTENGRRILKGAIDAGYLQLTPAAAWKLERSQGGLWRKKGSIWGRQLALRVLRIPHTHFFGANLWQCWKALSLHEKLRSTAGTIRRIIARKLYRKAQLSTVGATPVKPAISAAALPAKR